MRPLLPFLRGPTPRRLIRSTRTRFQTDHTVVLSRDAQTDQVNTSHATSPPDQDTPSTSLPRMDSKNPAMSDQSQSTQLQEGQQQQQAPLPLPSPSSSSTSQSLTVDGQAIKLDHLGPMVVNVDGTLSRIANWDRMAEVERQNTLRIIGKRNKARLERLRESEGVGGEGA